MIMAVTDLMKGTGFLYFLLLGLLWAPSLVSGQISTVTSVTSTSTSPSWYQSTSATQLSSSSSPGATVQSSSVTQSATSQNTATSDNSSMNASSSASTATGGTVKTTTNISSNTGYQSPHIFTVTSKTVSSMNPVSTTSDPGGSLSNRTLPSTSTSGESESYHTQSYTVTSDRVLSKLTLSSTVVLETSQSHIPPSPTSTTRSSFFRSTPDAPSESLSPTGITRALSTHAPLLTAVTSDSSSSHILPSSSSTTGFSVSQSYQSLAATSQSFPSESTLSFTAPQTTFLDTFEGSASLSGQDHITTNENNSPKSTLTSTGVMRGSSSPITLSSTVLSDGSVSRTSPLSSDTMQDSTFHSTQPLATTTETISPKSFFTSTESSPSRTSEALQTHKTLSTKANFGSSESHTPHVFMSTSGTSTHPTGVTGIIVESVLHMTQPLTTTKSDLSSTGNSIGSIPPTTSQHLSADTPYSSSITQPHQLQSISFLKTSPQAFLPKNTQSFTAPSRSSASHSTLSSTSTSGGSTPHSPQSLTATSGGSTFTTIQSFTTITEDSSSFTSLMSFSGGVSSDTITALPLGSTYTNGTSVTNSSSDMLYCPSFTCSYSECYSKYSSQNTTSCSSAYCQLLKTASMQYNVSCSSSCAMTCVNSSDTNCSVKCCNSTGCLNTTFASMMSSTTASTTTTRAPQPTTAPVMTTTNNGNKCEMGKCTGETCYSSFKNQNFETCTSSKPNCQLKKETVNSAVQWTAGCANCTGSTACTASTQPPCFLECCVASKTSCLMLNGTLNVPSSAIRGPHTQLITYVLCMISSVALYFIL